MVGLAPQGHPSLLNSPLSPFLCHARNLPLFIAGFSASKPARRQEPSGLPQCLSDSFFPVYTMTAPVTTPITPFWNGLNSFSARCSEMARSNDILPQEPAPALCHLSPAEVQAHSLPPAPVGLCFFKPGILLCCPGGFSVPVRLACSRSPSRHAHSFIPISVVLLSLFSQPRRLSQPLVYETFAYRPRSSVQSHFSQEASSETPDAIIIFPSLNCPKNVSMPLHILVY